MAKIAIGVVGCGTIAQVLHLPGIKTMVDMGKADLVAVCDAFPEKATAAKETFGARTSYADPDAMLREQSFDLLVNLTPIPEHFGVSLKALRAGRHVYTQKPMATTVDEATILIDEAKTRGLRLACAPEHPIRPEVRTMREMVAAGAIGKVTFAKMQSSHDGPEKHDVPRDSTWFYKADSGPILDMGVHGLSAITAILGPVERVACFSGRTQPVRVTTVGLFKGKRIDVEVDDLSLLMLDFGDARFAYLDASYCMPASRAPYLEIYGSDGVLCLERKGRERRLYHYRTITNEWTEVAVPPDSPLHDLGVLHMVEVLRGETDLILTGEHARHLVEVMARAPEAARSGCAATIETRF